MPRSNVVTIAARIKAEREADLASLVSSSIMNGAGTAVERIEGQARELGGAIRELGGMVTGLRVRRLYNYRALLDVVGSEVNAMASRSYDLLEANRTLLYAAGGEGMAELLAAQYTGDPELIQAMIQGRVTAVPMHKDYMIASDTMRRKFDALAVTTEEYVGDKIENLASLSQLVDPGNSVMTLATDGFGTAVAWATSMISMAYWSMFLLGMSAGIQNNANLTEGWVWWSRLDSKVCPSCISLHGQMFSVNDVMVDHPHGRCIPIPVVKDDLLGGYIFDDDNTTLPPVPEPWWPDETGEEWFAGLDPEMQQEILGPAAYAAWLAGAIELSSLSVDAEHDVYGTMKATTSLTHAIGAEAAKRFSLQGE